MQVVITSIEARGPHHFRSEVALDGRLVEHELEIFSEGAAVLAIDPALDGTREAHEIARLIRAHDEGVSLTLPHVVDPEDRWPALPSAGEPRPFGLMFQHRQVVLLALREREPRLWEADVTVDGVRDRVVVYVGVDPCQRHYVELSPTLSSARELRYLYHAILRASQGECLALPLIVNVPSGFRPDD